MSSQQVRQKLDRASIACENCRQRKVRCSGGDPCRDCTRLRKECIYPALQRRKRKAREGRDVLNPAGNKKLGAGGAARRSRAKLSHDAGDDVQLTVLDSDNPASTNTTPSYIAEGGEEEQRAPSIIRKPQHCSRRSQQDEPRQPRFAPPQSLNQLQGPGSRSEVSISHSPIDNHREDVLQSPGWEYYEPWSWLSLFSDVGTNWVCGIVQSRSFVGTAERFANDLAQQTTSDIEVLTDTPFPEPSEAKAWEYVEAFFQSCWESEVGFIDRSDFESRLHAHYRKEISGFDPAWYALRNVLFASGYRSLLVKDPSVSFATAHAKAGRFFNNALSVFVKLLLPLSGLMAIQALALMACYVEGFGSPEMKHFLISNAIHLAQSKGLHRQGEKSWGISEEEILKRNFLWWAIYSLEKLHSLSSCRPSTIDDDNVTAHVPTATPRGSRFDSPSLSIAYRHAILCSQISHQVLSIKALQVSTTELMATVTRIHNQLNQLIEEIPPDYRIGTLARPRNSPQRLIHILYMHLAIYGSLMAVHSHFFYPWLYSRFAAEGYNADLEAQLVFSANAVAEAARKIILAVRLVTTSASTPSWLAFYYPIYAHINLFIYLLRYPTLSTTSADLGLLDVSAGHFGYVEFLTSSQISISLPRETANLASTVVKAARAGDSVLSSTANTTSYECPEQEHDPQPPLEADNLNFEMLDDGSAVLDEAGNLVNLDSAPWLFSFELLNAGPVNSATLT